MSIPYSDIAILIVAGGSGTRMGGDIPKQYIPIHGKAIIRHTIEKMMPFGHVFCVIGEGQEDEYHHATQGLDDLPAPIIGGDTRQSSVFKGLHHIKNNTDKSYVLIHDAARPCFYPQDIHNIINTLKDNNNLTLAQPLNESIQRNGDTINRDNLWIIQTPQAFLLDDIVMAHDNAIKDQLTATDDTALMTHYGTPVHYTPSGRHNLKITTQDDLHMASQLLSPTYETRVGMGFDVHAFDDEKQTDYIRLCGIDIPHHKGLKGHSDADVGLHTITDAILGAIAQGDIGTHFPPSNNDYKDMDSHVFLDKSIEILKSHGGKIVHIDLTLICEAPKLGPHRQSIQNHLSNHMQLPTDRISIKATTTEQLGFTGRKEGIAAQAVVTVKVPCHD